MSLENHFAVVGSKDVTFFIVVWSSDKYGIRTWLK
jgi:hypothetical protein